MFLLVAIFKEPFTGVTWNICFKKFRKISWKECLLSFFRSSLFYRCSIKKLFLKISQNSQAGDLKLYKKRGYDSDVFLWILRSFWKHFFIQNTSNGYLSGAACVLRNFAKKKGKQLCQSLFITKEKFLGTHLIQITFGRLLLVSVVFSVKFEA